MNNVMLEVRDLTKYFDTSSGVLHAVDGLNFTLEKGKTLGLVGESGCGKTTTGRTILKLTEPSSGQIIFDGKDITKYNRLQMKSVRKDMQIIFQDPFSSIDPKMTVNQLIREAVNITGKFKSEEETNKRVAELMDRVGLSRKLFNSYPHELDGGRRQRIGIARALAVNPKLIICDEPVSALDVSIQAQILNLLKELQKDLGLTYIFITHDLSVVYYFADDIAVMYLGQLVEKAPADELFEHPIHPYTKALLSAIPSIDIDNQTKRIVLKGEISSPINLPDECRFAKRCDYCCEDCHSSDPKLIEVKPNHFVACHHPFLD